MINKSVLKEIIDFIPEDQLRIRATRIELSCFDEEDMPRLAWNFVRQGFKVLAYSPRHFEARLDESRIEIDVQMDRKS